jgi:hypothetical protein
MAETFECASALILEKVYPLPVESVSPGGVTGYVSLLVWG